MKDNSEKIDCDVDGWGYDAFVCQHLFHNPNQTWFSREPTSDNPWPDAWCSECDRVFMRDGEWNDDNSGCTSIKLLCHFCYERKRTQATSFE